VTQLSTLLQPRNKVAAGESEIMLDNRKAVVLCFGFTGVEQV
jgi:hypothetical protein